MPAASTTQRGLIQALGLWIKFLCWTKLPLKHFAYPTPI
jgi:hypothetical protein